MPPQQMRELQWKGPPVSRAKPIPAEKWEERREELCSLYQRMTLDDLMVMMKVRHTFTPSRRQYIFQFEKWGVNKYNTNPAGACLRPLDCDAGPSKPLPDSSSAQVDGHVSNSQASTIMVGPSKRPQSLHGSLHGGVYRNFHDRPPVPPMKRQKLAAFMSSKDPYTDLGAAFDASEPSFRSSESRQDLAQTIASLSKAPLSIVHGQTEVRVPTPGYLNDSTSWTTSNNSSDIEMLSQDSGEHTSMDLDDPEKWTNQQYSTSVRPKPIDSNRPIDTFSADEIRDMKQAADFLHALGLEEDAFALYVLIFKRVKDCSKQPPWMITSAMISCARTCGTKAQIEIVRNLLQQKLDQPQESIPGVEKFLFRMLLAETYERQSDNIIAQSHVNIAIEFNLADENLLMRLPQEHRCLDIITYLSLGNALDFPTAGCKEKAIRYRPKETYILDKEFYQRQLLHLVPGPFELKDGSMQNPSLRSCIYWCTDELGVISTIPSFGDAKHVKKENMYSREYISIYCCLWERLQSHLSNLIEEDTISWVDQAEKLMGISAAELLITVCSIIFRALPLRKRRYARGSVARALAGANTLSRLSDEDLGCQFLDIFYNSNIIVNFSSKEKGFERAARACARDFIERSLMITLPEVLSDILQAITPSATPRQSLNIVRATLLPTLASSLNSSELASLKTLRDRIQQNLRGAMQDATAVLPSTALRGFGSRSNWSVAMSELSLAMSSSLSLSSLHQAGDSTLESLVAIGSNVRGRVESFNYNKLE